MPKAYHRFIHRILMLSSVSSLLARILPGLDAFAIRLSKGRWTVTNLVGLPIIELITIGARSGKRRITPLVSLWDGDKIALIGSNFGKPRHPSWYHNLKAHPECEVRWNGKIVAYTAREAQGQEREKYWQLSLSYYAGYEKYKTRAGKRTIPVILLDPR